jgi:hypothetical protein
LVDSVFSKIGLWSSISVHFAVKKNENMRKIDKMYLLVLQWLLICVVAQVVIDTLCMADLLSHIRALWLFFFANHLLIIFEKLMSFIFRNCILYRSITLVVASGLTTALHPIVFVSDCLIGDNLCCHGSLGELLRLWHVCRVSCICVWSWITSRSTIDSVQFYVYIAADNGHHILGLRFTWIHIPFLKLLLLH